jgi:Tfp pilus assembly protein PilF
MSSDNIQKEENNPPVIEKKEEGKIDENSTFFTYGEYEKAKNLLQHAISIDTGYTRGCLLLSTIYLLEKNYALAKAQFENAMKTGLKSAAYILKDEDFMPQFRQWPEFTSLMRKYFPDQYKD